MKQGSITEFLGYPIYKIADEIDLQTTFDPIC